MQVSTEEIIAVLLSNLPENVPTIDNYEKPLADYGLDSLDQADLLLALEEKFGFTIPDEVIDKLSTASEIASYAVKRLSGK